MTDFFVDAKEPVKFAYTVNETNKNCFILGTDLFSCRERLESSWKQQTELYICSSNKSQFLNIANFVHITEDILDIKQKSICYSTINGFSLRVALSPFWLASKMRKSFISLILRGGNEYDNQHYEKALYFHDYTRSTKLAIIRFLSGYTIFNGEDKGNWVNTFKGKNAVFVKRSLTADNSFVLPSGSQDLLTN